MIIRLIYIYNNSNTNIIWARLSFKRKMYITHAHIFEPRKPTNSMQKHNDSKLSKHFERFTVTDKQIWKKHKASIWLVVFATAKQSKFINFIL